jgi:hypothetical protein
MAQKALEQRWPIKQEYREALVKRLMRIIADPNSSAREVTSASKALIAADLVNVAEDKNLEQEQKRKLELIELAHKLGIIGDDIGSIGVVDSQSSRIAND